MTKIAIGIIAYERPLITQRCIDSIRATTKVPYHIVVADNASQSRTAQEFIKKWQKDDNITVIRLEFNGGASAGRNAILDLVIDNYPIVAMLDNDNILLDGWDTAALSAFDAGYEVVSPKLLDDMNTLLQGPIRPWPGWWGVNPQFVGRGGPRFSPDVNNRENIEMFTGTAIFKTSIFARVGRYDERLWCGEDFDFSMRVASAGIAACYEPNCEMLHNHGFSPEYENIRHDKKKEIIAHIVIWEKHKKLLLSPEHLWLCYYVARRNQPWWLSRKKTPKSLLDRVWRRFLKFYFHRRYGTHWTSIESGEKATQDLIEKMTKLKLTEELKIVS